MENAQNNMYQNIICFFYQQIKTKEQK